MPTTSWTSIHKPQATPLRPPARGSNRGAERERKGVPISWSKPPTCWNSARWISSPCCSARAARRSMTRFRKSARRWISAAIMPHQAANISARAKPCRGRPARAICSSCAAAACSLRYRRGIFRWRSSQARLRRRSWPAMRSLPSLPNKRRGSQPRPFACCMRPACLTRRCIWCAATAALVLRWWRSLISPVSSSPDRPRSPGRSIARWPPRTARSCR